MTTQKNAQKTPIFVCEKCDFKCCKQSDYDRHVVTIKHKRLHGTTKKKTPPIIRIHLFAYVVTNITIIRVYQNISERVLSSIHPGILCYMLRYIIKKHTKRPKMIYAQTIK